MTNRKEYDIIYTEKDERKKKMNIQKKLILNLSPEEIDALSMVFNIADGVISQIEANEDISDYASEYDVCFKLKNRLIDFHDYFKEEF